MIRIEKSPAHLLFKKSTSKESGAKKSSKPKEETKTKSISKVAVKSVAKSLCVSKSISIDSISISDESYIKRSLEQGVAELDQALCFKIKNSQIEDSFGTYCDIIKMNEWTSDLQLRKSINAIYLSKIRNLHQMWICNLEENDHLLLKPLFDNLIFTKINWFYFSNENYHEAPIKNYIKMICKVAPRINEEFGVINFEMTEKELFYIISAAKTVSQKIEITANIEMDQPFEIKSCTLDRWKAESLFIKITSHGSEDNCVLIVQSIIKKLAISKDVKTNLKTIRITGTGVEDADIKKSLAKYGFKNITIS